MFHSAAEDMLPYQGQLPFAAVADPGRNLYDEFGVTASPRAVLHPKAWTSPRQEHIYVKIGASSRATASLFAMQHGLLRRSPRPGLTDAKMGQLPHATWRGAPLPSDQGSKDDESRQS